MITLSLVSEHSLIDSYLESIENGDLRLDPEQKLVMDELQLVYAVNY